MDRDITCFKETTDNRGQGRYTLVRFYRHHDTVIRVTVKRDNYPDQSHAHAEVLTPVVTWTTLVNDAPCNWHGRTSIHADKPTEAHRKTGFTTLAQVADALYHDAIEILFP